MPTTTQTPGRLTPSKNIGPVVSTPRGDYESTRWTVEAGALAFTSSAFCISMELRGDSKTTRPVIEEIARRYNAYPALVEALRPFANFACDEPHVGEPECHNCIARAAIAKATAGE